MSCELTAAQIDALERAELARLDSLATDHTRIISFPALSILDNKTKYLVDQKGDILASDVTFLTGLLEKYFTTETGVLDLSSVISAAVRAVNQTK